MLTEAREQLSRLNALQDGMQSNGLSNSHLEGHISALEMAHEPTSSRFIEMEQRTQLVVGCVLENMQPSRFFDELWERINAFGPLVPPQQQYQHQTMQYASLMPGGAMDLNAVADAKLKKKKGVMGKLNGKFDKLWDSYDHMRGQLPVEQKVARDKLFASQRQAFQQGHVPKQDQFDIGKTSMGMPQPPAPTVFPMFSPVMPTVMC
jgi:hypothetical protein